MVHKVDNSDEEFLLRVKTIMVLRVVFLTGFVALIVLFQNRFGFAASLTPLTVVIGSGYLLSLIYALLLKFWKPSVGAILQVTGDLIVVGGILYTTGGIHSPLSFLFLFVIIATSVVLPQSVCYLVASGASIIYGLLVDLEYYHIIQPVYIFQNTNVSFERGYGFYIIILNIVSYYSVAYLSSILSNRLKIVKEELVTASIDLKELQAFHSSVVQDMGNGLLTTDLKGRITSMNRAAEEATGYVIEECSEKPAGQLLAISDLENLFRNPNPEKLPLEIEGECTRKDGKNIFIRMKISRLLGDGSPVKGYICVFEDLTEVKEMRERFVQAEQLAALGRFSAGMAHEIRNPLASISGSIQVLHKGLKLEDSYKNLMKIVIKETDRLNGILSEFLNYSQPRITEKSLVDLTQIVMDSVTLMKNSGEYHPLNSIEVEETGDHLIISADEEQIKQMVWNLCMNGLKAMPQGGALKITLKKVSSFHTIGFKSDRRGIMFIVEDEGCGIPENQIKEVFDPFFTTRENGVGLGLANVYQTVQILEGSIEVESKVDRGTKFTVYIPKGEVGTKKKYNTSGKIFDAATQDQRGYQIGPTTDSGK